MADCFRVDGYCRPQRLDEAIDGLVREGPQARILAGGTDLLVQKPDLPLTLIDISDLDLGSIQPGDRSVEIGAACNINQLRRSPFLTDGAHGIIGEAASHHSTATIRNMATIGGNVCNASPCADLALPLLVLDAVLTAVGPDGERTILITELFRDVNRTSLQQNEIMTHITLPSPPASAGWCFMKLRRHQTAIDIALVNTAVWLRVTDGVIQEGRIALGSVAPTPMRAHGAEALLKGQKASPDLFREVALAAADETNPIDDIRSTAAYRKRMTAVLVRRSLETSLARCSA